MTRYEVSAERSRCVGAGHCLLSSPAVFDQDDEGVVVVLDGTPPESELAAVRQAAELCPSGAVRFTLEEEAAARNA